MLKFVFDNLKFVSVNALYVNIPGQARRFKSKAAKDFEAAIVGAVEANIITNKLSKQVEDLAGKKLIVTITLRSDTWLTKAGTIRKVDASSAEKLLTDSVFTALSNFCSPIDDSQIFQLTILKAAGEQQITYAIGEYEVD